VSPAVRRPAGVLRVRPGDPRPLRCERPIAEPRVFDALVRGRDAAALPSLFAGLFTLCADLHRMTAARAIDTALGRPPSEARLAHEAEYARASCLRDHLTRLGLELPVRAPMAGVPVDARWLRELPAAPRGLEGAPHEAVTEHARALAAFTRARLFGERAPADRLRSADAVASWAHDCAAEQPAAHWLACAEPLARTIALALACLPLAAAPEPGARWLASALVADPELALHPHWHGEAVATGPYSRARGAFHVETLWDVLAARIRDLALLCVPEPWLRVGVVAIASGEAVAYTEMARGLLVHWVKLAPDAGVPKVAAYRILSPTDWTFHAHGALARLLREPMPAERVRLAVAAFDSCLDAEFG
jgi:hypothetical protein